MPPAARDLFDGLNALALEVDESIVKDLRDLAQKAIDEALTSGPIKLAEFSPREGVTVMVTMPHNSPPGMVTQAAEAMKRHFPDHEILFKTDDWKVEDADREEHQRALIALLRSAADPERMPESKCKQLRDLAEEFERSLTGDDS